MKVIVNDNIFKCKVCTTVDSIVNGMMGKRFDGFDGMFFMLPEKKDQEFWMYNCIVPLDIIMIDDNFRQFIKSQISLPENKWGESFKNYIQNKNRE